jgi:hypothetical protein
MSPDVAELPNINMLCSHSPFRPDKLQFIKPRTLTLEAALIPLPLPLPPFGELKYERIDGCFPVTILEISVDFFLAAIRDISSEERQTVFVEVEINLLNIRQAPSTVTCQGQSASETEMKSIFIKNVYVKP